MTKVGLEVKGHLLNMLDHPPYIIHVCAGVFDIDEGTGSISLVRSLDRETTDRYEDSSTSFRWICYGKVLLASVKVVCVLAQFFVCMNYS